MDLYPWVVFVHIAATLLFFIAHGTSMAVSFAIKREQNPDRLRALLDVSLWALGPSGVAVLLGLLAGIVAAFMGGWWGDLWVWISLVLFLAVGIGMTPLVAVRLNAIRIAAGQAVGKTTEPPTEDLEEVQRLLDAWNPTPIAIAGLGAFLVILWLMYFKPF